MKMIPGKDFEVRPNSTKIDPDGWEVKILVPRYNGMRIAYHDIRPTDYGTMAYRVQVLSYPTLDPHNRVESVDVGSAEFVDVANRILETILDELLRIRDNTI